ncbi:MAG TPA: pyridoxamine 5'-phosphate oxidase family protein [Burkholderiaceae bacterium]|nr:pyridoxamine 5'-phosphate oxidase family protein [Burkholderiaceae bacterium]
MGLRLPPEVAGYLAGQHVMTLATTGAAGPWAAAVFYAMQADDLIFLSSPQTRHCIDLAHDARCAATIQAQPGDWRSIQGVQIEGRVDELDGAALAAGREAYAERFPFVRPAGAPAAIVAALARVRWYRLRVARLWFIDNARGFGDRRQFDA